MVNPSIVKFQRVYEVCIHQPMKIPLKFIVPLFSDIVPGEGVLIYIRYTGMCRLDNGSLFLPKIPKHGVGLLAGKYLNTGLVSDFSQNTHYESGFTPNKNGPKISNFRDKIPKNGYYFRPK